MTTHGFLGVFPNRQVVAEIARVQGILRETQGFEAIPRRLVHLTLDDLGPIQPEALEAAALACERALSTFAPLTVRSREIVQLGPIVALTFDDPKDRLRDLRAALHAGLAGYGFALDKRAFVPHVTLGRGPLPAVLPPAPSLSLRVEHVSLMRQAPEDDLGPPWLLAWEGEVGRARPRAPGLDDPAERDAQIRALLEARLASRAERRAAVELAQASATPQNPRSRRGRRKSGRPTTSRKSS